MKKSILSLLGTVATTVLAVAMFTACAKEELLSPEDNNYPEVVKLSNVDAQTAFAKILSRAVSNSKEVRSFIKTEALAQFDNDYDVFYPFVKDKEVADGKTFRDILLSYCDDEEELIQIEESALLLNILVPDLTLFWDFDAERWNADDDNIAVTSNADIENIVYEKGEPVGALQPDQIPAFPCLVVNNNERLVVNNGATRSSDAAYVFAHDAFDPSKTNTMTRDVDHSYWDMDIEEPESETPYVKASDLDPTVIAAYNEFKNMPNAFQRDYVYYNITKSNPKGVLYKNTYEELLQFKLDKNIFDVISDQSPDPDLNMESMSPGWGHAGRDKWWVLERAWQTGKFEIVIKTFISSTSNMDVIGETPLVFSASASDLFSIDKAHVDYKHGTWFSAQHYGYTINYNDLSTKWFRPRSFGQVLTIPWDLSNTSMSMHVFAYERDENETVSIEKSVSSQFASSSNFESSGTEDGTTYKVGYGANSTISHTSTLKTLKEKGSEELGWTFLNYSMPVIVNDSKKDTDGYELRYINTGSIKLVIVPVRM